MHDENPVKPEATAGPKREISAYAAGVVDGGECRRRGGAISTLRRVAINCDYSAGFRAGYFQRDR